MGELGADTRSGSSLARAWPGPEALLEISGIPGSSDVIVGLLAAVLHGLPDAIMLLRAVRDERGVAVDLRVEHMNELAHAQRSAGPSAVGRICGELWPDMVRSGVFRRCLRVADTGHLESGFAEHATDHMGRLYGMEHWVLPAGPDLVFLVERDCSDLLRAQAQVAEGQSRVRQLEADLHEATAKLEAEAEQRRAAMQDPLTGLPNRAVLVDRTGHALARAKRYSDPTRSTAMLAVDIDRFSEINSMGRSVGDATLKAVAARLLASVRQEDTVSRLAADQFVVLCDHIDAVGLARLRARVVDAVTQPLIWRQDGASRLLAVAVSIGMTMAQEDDTVDALLQRVRGQLAKSRSERRIAPVVDISAARNEPAGMPHR